MRPHTVGAYQRCNSFVQEVFGVIKRVACEERAANLPGSAVSFHWLLNYLSCSKLIAKPCGHAPRLLYSFSRPQRTFSGFRIGVDELNPDFDHRGLSSISNVATERHQNKRLPLR